MLPPNIDFRAAQAESLPFVQTASADAVVAGQAAHWFNQPRWWPEMARVLRPGGTLAVWGYQNPAIVRHPGASRVLHDYAYGLGEDRLGDYWTQPGCSVVENLYRDIIPPDRGWENVQRIEYEPDTLQRQAGRGEVLMKKAMKIGDAMEYVRTWSAFHEWSQAHPDIEKTLEGGRGDVVDKMFVAMKEAEVEWSKDPAWRDREVHLEWGTGLLLARRAESLT